jgi:integrase
VSAGVERRVRVLAALSGGDDRPGPARPSTTVVVDVPASRPPFSYYGAHRAFEHLTCAAGISGTLHSLRHTAAYRMAEETRPCLLLTSRRC